MPFSVDTPDDYYQIRLSYTTVCNYKCSYCIGNQKGKKEELSTETVEAIIKYIDSLEGEVEVLLVGAGEPTLYESTKELLKRLKNETVVLATNLSADITEYNKYYELCPTLKILASYHSEMADADKFFEKAQKLGKHTVSILLTPESFDESLRLYNKYKDLVTIDPNIVRPYNLSEEQTEQLKQLDIKINEKRYNLDGIMYSYLDLAVQKKTRFKHWLCKGGNKVLNIYPDGRVTNCQDGLAHSIYSPEKLKIGEYRICGSKSCECRGNLERTKYRMSEFNSE